MSLGHEKLDVYRLSIDYVAWVCGTANRLNGVHRFARDQWLRASQSISLNIAEGNGKATEGERRRYFEIARGSALECAAVQDVLVACHVLDEHMSCQHKRDLDRMAMMLSRLGGRGYAAQEDTPGYGRTEGDFDFDSDFEPSKRKSQPEADVDTPSPVIQPER